MCQHCRTIQLILSILAPEFSVPWNSWDPKLLRSVSVFFCTAFSSRICEVMSKIAPWWKQEIPTHQKSHHEWGKNCFFQRCCWCFWRHQKSAYHRGQLELQGPKCPRRIRGVLGEVIHALRGSHQGHLKVTAKIIHPMVVFWCTQFLQQHLHLYGIIWDYMGLYMDKPYFSCAQFLRYWSDTA